MAVISGAKDFLFLGLDAGLVSTIATMNQQSKAIRRRRLTMCFISTAKGYPLHEFFEAEKFYDTIQKLI